MSIFKKKGFLSSISRTKEDVLDSLEEEVLILDLNYKIVYANRKFLEQKESSLSQIVGKYCYQISHNLDKPCHMSGEACPLNEVAKNSLPCKVIHLHTDLGKKRYMEISASPLKDKKEKVVGAVELFRDVTEAEREKKESEEKYRHLIEKSHDAIAILQDNQIKLANQKFVDESGYTREELKTLNFIEGIAPECREMVVDRYLRRQRGEEVPDHYEFTLLTKSGQRKDVEMRVALIEYRDRVASYCFLRDITEKKKAEDELKQVKDYLDNIINTSQVAITVIDSEGNFSVFNQGAERLTGYQAEEVLGKKTIYDFYANNKQELDYIQRKLSEGGLIENFETGLLKKDGSRIPISISVSLLKDPEGNPIGSIGVSTDITARKKAEKEIGKQFDRLQTIYQLTGSLSHAQKVDEIYDETLNALEKTLKAERSAILLFDPDGVMRFKAWRGLSETYRRTVEGHSPWTPEEKNPQPVLIPDAEKEPSLEKLKDVIRNEGIRALGFIPLFCQGRLLGKFMIYYNTPHLFDKDEIRLLQTIAGHIAFAIERTRAEETLRKSEDKYRFLYEKSPMVNLIIGKDGIIRDINEAMIEKFGYTKDEIVGQPALEFVVPEQRGKVSSQLEKDFKGEHTSETDVDIKAKDGTIHTLLFSPGGVILYEGAQPASLLITGIDVTERKKAEQKIIQANKELSALNAISSITNQSLDLDRILNETLDKVLEVTDCQAGGIYILGKTDRWLELKACKGISPEAIREAERLKLGEGFSGRIASIGEPIMVEDINQDPRLTRMIMKREGLQSYLGVPLKSKGKILGTLFVITRKDRKFNQNEVQLLASIANQIGMAVENAYLFKEAEQWIVQLEAIRNITNRLNKLNDVKTVAYAVMEEIKKVIEFDNCRVFLLSDSREELVPIAFGSEVEEYKGENEEVLRLKVGEGITGWVAQTMEGQIIDDGERHPRSRHIPGTPYLDESIIASPMIYEGVVRGVITLSKLGLKCFNQNHLALLSILANEAVVAIENAKLFEGLKQAYAKLKEAQEQLVQSEKLRALGEMAGGVAHDFNNLLGAILGRAQLLLFSTQEPNTRKGLKVIEKASLDGAETVRRIQEFTRLRTDENFIPVDLNQILTESLEMTKHKWKDESQKKGVSIQVETALEKNLPWIAGNPTELREVFVNMILNSVDAMPNGGALSISSRFKENFVLASVTDTGTGMSEEVQKKVFDPFFTTKGPKGNGLGMSLAYGIVVRHNGEISIESQEGKGTTFSVKLPQNKMEDKNEDIKETGEVPRNEDILIIDDEPAIRELLCDILQSKGYKAVAVNNSLKGLELFKEKNFDIVFTDLSMPEMSGWEVADKLKALDPEVVIVMVTGWGTQVDAKKLKAHSVDLLMAKPFEVKKLFEVLNDAERIKKKKEEKKPEKVAS